MNAPLSAPLTISALAKRFGLSRSTLLYYDRIGLLRAGLRSKTGYRSYGPGEVLRLQRIIELRAAGLSLAKIKSLLAGEGPLLALLVEQLHQLNQEMQLLRRRQRQLLDLLEATTQTPEKLGGILREHGVLDKAAWTSLFREIGLSDEAMGQWHARFEQAHPQAHQLFLQGLGIAEEDVARIRAWSRSLGCGGHSS